jgi:hypothetical protein
MAAQKSGPLSQSSQPSASIAEQSTPEGSGVGSGSATDGASGSDGIGSGSREELPPALDPVGGGVASGPDAEGPAVPAFERAGTETVEADLELVSSP